jgi:hypothetical protein
MRTINPKWFNLDNLNIHCNTSMNTQDVLFPDYVEFSGYYKNEDFKNAASVFLKLLKIMCSNPQVHEEYQLSSLAHFIKAASNGPDITFEAFEHLLRGFLTACQSGKLIDTRIVSN